MPVVQLRLGVNFFRVLFFFDNKRTSAKQLQTQQASRTSIHSFTLYSMRHAVRQHAQKTKSTLLTATWGTAALDRTFSNINQRSLLHICITTLLFLPTNQAQLRASEKRNLDGGNLEKNHPLRDLSCAAGKGTQSICSEEKELHQTRSPAPRFQA